MKITEAREYIGSALTLKDTKELVTVVRLVGHNLVDVIGCITKTKMTVDANDLSVKTIHVVFSDRTGAHYTELRVIEQHVCGHILSGINAGKNVIRYKLDAQPYEIDIIDGESAGSNVATGTGIGDLWSHTNYGTFSKQDAMEYMASETSRIDTKYA